MTYYLSRYEISFNSIFTSNAGMMKDGKGWISQKRYFPMFEIARTTMVSPVLI